MWALKKSKVMEGEPSGLIIIDHRWPSSTHRAQPMAERGKRKGRDRKEEGCQGGWSLQLQRENCGDPQYASSIVSGKVLRLRVIVNFVVIGHVTPGRTRALVASSQRRRVTYRGCRRKCEEEVHK